MQLLNDRLKALDFTTWNLRAFANADGLRSELLAIIVVLVEQHLLASAFIVQRDVDVWKEPIRMTQHRILELRSPINKVIALYWLAI